ncbi:hypothetical protein BT69DRAFT_362962 [Atractiella rhizophila]|nr:hypothetical protein BT69DRAFT_362962 [Atractiella rhizophila]
MKKSMLTRYMERKLFIKDTENIVSILNEVHGRVNAKCKWLFNEQLKAVKETFQDLVLKNYDFPVSDLEATYSLHHYLALIIRHPLRLGTSSCPYLSRQKFLDKSDAMNLGSFTRLQNIHSYAGHAYHTNQQGWDLDALWDPARGNNPIPLVLKRYISPCPKYKIFRHGMCVPRCHCHGHENPILNLEADFPQQRSLEDALSSLWKNYEFAEVISTIPTKSDERGRGWVFMTANVAKEVREAGGTVGFVTNYALAIQFVQNGKLMAKKPEMLEACPYTVRDHGFIDWMIEYRHEKIRETFNLNIVLFRRRATD